MKVKRQKKKKQEERKKLDELFIIKGFLNLLDC